MASERLRSALINLRAAARKVPIIRRPDDGPPFSICLGCKAVDDEDCRTGCWVSALEAACFDADVAIGCQCCGKPLAYDGALRCGAACTARHEAKRCRCYQREGDHG